MRTMVWLFLVLLGSVFLTTCTQTTEQGSRASADTIRIGMGLDDFKSIAADAVQDAGNPERFLRNDRLFGVDGRWTYYFNSGVLRWYVFNAYESRVSKEGFERFLQSSEEILLTYDRDLGKARKVRRGITRYNDPKVQSHNGYLVQQAIWDSPEGKRIMEFSFLGDHRNYALLLSVHVGQ